MARSSIWDFICQPSTVGGPTPGQGSLRRWWARSVEEADEEKTG